MLQALSGIIDFLVTIVLTIQSFVSTLIGFFGMIPQGVGLVTGAIASLPPVLTVFATATVSLSVLLFIIGR